MIHMLPAEMFPITFKIYSGSTGELLWSKVVTRPDSTTEFAAIEIPGFAGTGHTPVRVDVIYADGSTDTGGLP